MKRKTSKPRPTYRPIRKQLSEDEARHLLGIAYQQRLNCMEVLISIRLGGVTPLIQVLCGQTLDEIVEENSAQIKWLDSRIEDLKRFLPSPSRYTECSDNQQHQLKQNKLWRK